MQVESLRVVLSPQGLDRICGYCGREWDLGQGPAIRPPESKRAVGLSIDLITLLVHRAMVPATEQGEVRERGRAALGPMMEVMSLPEPEPAAREAAALVSMVERAPQCGRRPWLDSGAPVAPSPLGLASPARRKRFCRNAPFSDWPC